MNYYHWNTEVQRLIILLIVILLMVLLLLMSGAALRFLDLQIAVPV